MVLPTYFNIAPESQIGEVYGTEFTFTANFPYQYTKFVWNFGDRSELVYETETVTHTYNMMMLKVMIIWFFLNEKIN